MAFPPWSPDGCCCCSHHLCEGRMRGKGQHWVYLSVLFFFLSLEESVAGLPLLQKRTRRSRGIECLSNTVPVTLPSHFSIPVLDQQHLLAACRRLTPPGGICILVESNDKESSWLEEIHTGGRTLGFFKMSRSWACVLEVGFSAS